MDTHEALVRGLTAAVRDGEDPLPVLRAAQDHVAGCSTCRARAAQLLVAALGEEGALLMALAEREEAGELEVAPPPPAFELSFLAEAEGATSSVTSRRGPAGPAGTYSQLPSGSAWQWVTPGPRSDPGQRERRLAGDVRLRVRLSRRHGEASFQGLSDWLQSSVTSSRGSVAAAGRGGAPDGQGEVLTLPDPEGRLQITLAVLASARGDGHISVEVSDLATGRPVERAHVELRADAGGGEGAVTRAGRATFLSVTPGDYTIEVRPAGAAFGARNWRLSLTLEAVETRVP
jgi:hypothetical protein